MIVNCSLCSKRLVKEGALVFGPPVSGGICEKYHICIDCWSDIVRKVLEGNNNKRGGLELDPARSHKPDDVSSNLTPAI